MRICGDRYILTFAGRPPSSDGTLANGPVAGGWNSGSISASVSSVSGRGFEVRRLLAVTILFLAGCGPRLPPPGAGTNNYLRDAPESLERVMAIESVDILETLYDPHTTGFHLLARGVMRLAPTWIPNSGAAAMRSRSVVCPRMA